MAYRTNERGFALVAAVFALVIIFALVTGAFFAARQEMRTGRSSQTYQRAFDAAEAGLNNTVATWDNNRAVLNAMAVGDSVPISGTLPSSTGSYAGTVRRLNNELFVIRTVGADPTGTSQRTLAALVRLKLLQTNFLGAATTRGNLRAGGSSLITGNNLNPPGWSCPTGALDSVPGVVMPDTNLLFGSSSFGSICGTPGGCVQGQPPVVQDPTINDSTFFKFGDLNWNDVIATANKTYTSVGGFTLTTVAPVGTATTCTTAVIDNWGEPARPPLVAGCTNYFPIIYINAPSVRLSRGRGQGLLLIEGDLDASGNFEFFGPVIVRGQVMVTGTGNTFTGGIMAANADLNPTIFGFTGDAVVRYSSCAITNALSFIAPGRILRERSWAELF